MAPLKSHLTHYGAWKDADIPLFRRFGMAALQPRMYSGTNQEAQAIGGDKAAGLNLLIQALDKKDYFPDYGVAGLAYAYTRGAGAANGIKDLGNRGVTERGIRIAAQGGAYVIVFANPGGNADILIRDLRGRRVGEAMGITGGRFEWSPPAGGPGVFIVMVRTGGSVSYGKFARGF